MDEVKWKLSDIEGKAWRVDQGSATVFAAPVLEGMPLRRLFITEAREGMVVPYVAQRMSVYIEAEYITLLLVPSEGAVLSLIDEPSDADRKFYASLQMDGESGEQASETDFGGFRTIGEFVAELWEMHDVTELRGIYTSEEANEAARDQNIKRILKVFDKRESRQEKAEHTGKHLYDAAARLCAFQKINIKPWDIIRDSVGDKMTIHDICRVSNFVCREVILSEEWYKQDNGPLLVYYGSKRTPMACIPRNSQSYDLYDPVTDTTARITDETAAEIRPRAMCFYRPFPEKPLNWKDMIQYSAVAMRRSDLAVIILFTLIGTLIGQFMPYLNEVIFDKYIPLGDFSGLYGICMVVLAFSVGNIFFSLVSSMASFRFLNRIKYQLEAAIVDRLFSLPEPFYRKFESADLAERAMAIAEFFTKLIDILLKNILTALFAFIYLFKMFSCSVSLSWIALFMCLVGDGIGFVLGFMQIRHKKEKMKIDGRISSLLFQLISGVGKLRIAGAEERGIREYTKIYSDSVEVGIKAQKFDRLAGVTSMFFGTMTSVILYYYMIHKSLGLTIGTFMAFNAAYGALSGALETLVSSFLEVNSMIPVYDRMKPILETSPEYSEAQSTPGQLTGEIELNNVRFSYDENSPEILHGISLLIRPGEYIGIVGETGGGKSTLLKLLLGFETPTLGKIYYDGMDLEMVDKRELRKKFGVVLQNGGLIAGTIYENITITYPSATEEEVNEAIANAGLTEDIKKMPMGLYTLLSEGDGSVSGGQKQRILIARAIVGKPKIIFFDEATSALDNNTQRIVKEGLDSLNSTRVVIAHRLSTIINCDRILVLHDGVIAESGNFNELMEQKGYFYELARRQLA